MSIILVILIFITAALPVMAFLMYLGIAIDLCLAVGVLTVFCNTCLYCLWLRDPGVGDLVIDRYDGNMVCYLNNVRIDADILRKLDSVSFNVVDKTEERSYITSTSKVKLH